MALPARTRFFDERRSTLQVEADRSRGCATSHRRRSTWRVEVGTRRLNMATIPAVRSERNEAGDITRRLALLDRPKPVQVWTGFAQPAVEGILHSAYYRPDPLKRQTVHSVHSVGSWYFFKSAVGRPPREAKTPGS